MTDLTIELYEEIEEDDSQDFIRDFEEISKQNQEAVKSLKPVDDNKRQKFDSADYMMKHNKQAKANN
jgi:hypothetical protein